MSISLNSPNQIAKIAIDDTTYYFDKLYDYIIPIQLSNKILKGQRVLVPFGRGNQKRLGMVLDIEDYPDLSQKGIHYFMPNGKAVKPIIKLIDIDPIINQEMINIIFWLKENTFCNYFEAVKIVIPSGLRFKISTKYEVNRSLAREIYGQLSPDQKLVIEHFGFKGPAVETKGKYGDKSLFEVVSYDKIILEELISKGILIENDIFKRKIQDQKSLMVKLVDNIENTDQKYNLTSKQKAVKDFLLDIESASVKEIKYLCGVTQAVLDNLEKKGIIKYFELEIYRKPYENLNEKKYTDILLTEKQLDVFNKLKILLNKDEYKISLIHGVTGSGKTLIFIKIIQTVLSKGNEVIVLVPEISLIPQMVDALKGYFGDKVAVLHSGLTLSNRLDEWKRINDGRARIVLGTRSAIFSPLKNIGLIIMDEEQEMSYKSENSPRYHARDIAALRCVTHNALFLMASATPSIETYYRLKKRNLPILKLNERYNGSTKVDISIVDMRKEKEAGNETLFSRELIKAIAENISKNQQTIIFINRRGYNTIIKCCICGTVEICDNCSIAMTYHKTNKRLICHYCGYSKTAVKQCVNCGSNYIQYNGVGTQKIESQLESILPDSKILRMDSDTTIARFSHDRYFQDFADKKYDILIGTQMIAKGVNFPDVTLVGVIDADQSIYSNDYRGIEKTYNLITQVAGRSGRGNILGKAIIQTNCSDNDIFDIIVNGTYEDFFDQEIQVRKSLFYPPFCDLSTIGIVGYLEKDVISIGEKIFSLMKYYINKDFKDLPIKILGPIPDNIIKVNNKFRYKVIIKHKSSKRYKHLIHAILMNISKDIKDKNVRVFIDKI